MPRSAHQKPVVCSHLANKVKRLVGVIRVRLALGVGDSVAGGLPGGALGCFEFSGLKLCRPKESSPRCGSVGFGSCTENCSEQFP